MSHQTGSPMHVSVLREVALSFRKVGGPCTTVTYVLLARATGTGL